MNFNEKIEKNFRKSLGIDDYSQQIFIKATDSELNKLKELIGNNAIKVIDFYSDCQPYELPMLDCYVSLCNIDRIIDENSTCEPGKYLAEYGVFVFAVTVGGNALCIDTNDIKNGDPSVLFVASDFCWYNDVAKCVEIAEVPEKIEDKFGDEIIELNYKNIRMCALRLEKSFTKFIEKLSKNKYDDIEEYLDF